MVDDFDACGLECYDMPSSTCWLIGLISSTLSLPTLPRAWHPVYTWWDVSVKWAWSLPFLSDITCTWSLSSPSLSILHWHPIVTCTCCVCHITCTWSLSSPSLRFVHSPRDKHHMCESSSLDAYLLHINTLSMKQYRWSLKAHVFHSCVYASLGHVLYIMWSSRRKSHIA